MSAVATTRRALALLGACAVAGIAACGSSTTSAPTVGPDPASIVPADAPVYLDATLRPQGDQRAAIEGALSKLLGTGDVAGMLIGKLDHELAKDGLSYASDIAPWLGQRSGLFFSSIGSSSDGAAVLSATDPAAAQAAMEKAASASAKYLGGKYPHGGGIQKASYEGISYEVSNDIAYGVVGDFAVIGTADGFKAAVDASKGSSLADSSRYTSSLATAPGDRIATAWADPKGILAAVVKSGAIPSTANFNLQQLSQQPVAAWLEAAPDHLAFEFSATGSHASNASSLITGFPDSAWLAFGAAGVGKGLAQGLQSLPTKSFHGVSAAGALRRFRAMSGLDLANIGRWLGDVSGYVSGSDVFSIGGALVLSSRDASASARTLAEIQRVVAHDADLSVSPLGGDQQGFAIRPASVPVEIDVGLRDGKLIAGLGAGSIDAALSPSASLGDSAAFKSAAAALGAGIVPSFYLDFQPILGFLSFPGVPSSPSLEQVKPYLDRLDYVVAGAGHAGGRTDARLVLGLRDATASSGNSGDVSASRDLPVAAVR